MVKISSVGFKPNAVTLRNLLRHPELVEGTYAELQGNFERRAINEVRRSQIPNDHFLRLAFVQVRYALVPSELRSLLSTPVSGMLGMTQ